MILTKNEFLKKFGYNSRTSLTRLIKAGKIVLNENKEIDFSNSTNKKWKKEFSQNKKNAKSTKTATKTVKKTEGKNESPEQLKLIAHSQKIKEGELKTELLQLKLAKERNSVVDTVILAKVLSLTFSNLFKSLIEFPNRYSVDILNLIAANPTNAQTVLTDFLTQKITQNLDMALKDSKIATKKYLKNDND